MRSISRAVVLSALALSIPAVYAAPAPKAAAAVHASQAPEISYQSYKLSNGLEVLLHEDHKLPIVAVDIWYHVGPVKERAGRTGFAHLFEHMMFEGSKHVGEKAHFKYLEAAGATDINGTTSFDRTNYFETVPANQLETGALAGERPHGLPAGYAGPRQADQPARRGAQREAAGRGATVRHCR